MNCIIFSFNRPMQLDALLRSMEKFNLLQSQDVTVIYNYDNIDFQIGHEKVANLFSNYKINWKKEQKSYIKKTLFFSNISNLKHWIKYRKKYSKFTNFKDLIEKSIIENESKMVYFLTDDCYFYREPIFDPQILQKIINDNKYSYSLRLNPTVSGNVKFNRLDTNYYCWNYYQNNIFSDWTYPFSVDGHIYNKESVLELCQKLIYTNPNSFESIMYGLVKRKKKFSIGICHSKASLLNIELNVVQTFCNTTNHNEDILKLNKYYLDGYSINYNLNLENYNSPHIKPAGVTIEKDSDIILISEINR